MPLGGEWTQEAHVPLDTSLFLQKRLWCPSLRWQSSMAGTPNILWWQLTRKSASWRLHLQHLDHHIQDAALIKPQFFYDRLSVGQCFGHTHCCGSGNTRSMLWLLNWSLENYLKWMCVVCLCLHLYSTQLSDHLGLSVGMLPLGMVIGQLWGHSVKDKNCTHLQLPLWWILWGHSASVNYFKKYVGGHKKFKKAFWKCI